MKLSASLSFRCGSPHSRSIDSRRRSWESAVSTSSSSFVLLAVLVVFLGVKTVPQGYNWTVERFGRYTKHKRFLLRTPPPPEAQIWLT